MPRRSQCDETRVQAPGPPQASSQLPVPLSRRERRRPVPPRTPLSFPAENAAGLLRRTNGPALSQGGISAFLLEKVKISHYICADIAKANTDMTDEELNKYRLTSLEEPSDEALHCIMAEAAAIAREKAAKAQQALEDSVKAMIEEDKRQA